MEKKNGYDAVVFDMDGVIFDSERAVMQCWKELADKYQIPDIEKAVLSCTGTTMKRTREIMLEIYGEDFPYAAYKQEMRELLQTDDRFARLDRDAAMVIRTMTNTKFKIDDTQTDRDKPVKGCWNFEFF